MNSYAVLSLTTKNIYLCGADRINAEGTSLQLTMKSNCAQKNQMPGRVVNPLMKNNYAVLKKSIAGQAKVYQ